MKIQTKLLSPDTSTALERYEESLQAALETGLQNGLEAICQTAKDLAPVDTGALRESITVQRDETAGRVTATAPHALFVEKGTVHQAAKPFLYPAFAQHQGAMCALIKEALHS